MKFRLRLFISILIVCLLCDAAAWYATYRLVNAPSAEQLALQARGTPTPSFTTIDQLPGAASERISLNGPWLYKQTGGDRADFFQPELDTSTWREMRIPQSWFLAGLNYHGVIWFRRQFSVPTGWQGRSISLGFEGVDYYADVYLNGVPLGGHTGYFEPFSFDITDKVRYDQPNFLAVRVDSPYETYGTAYPGNKTLIKGIFSQDRSRPGGNWNRSGQEYNTGGIWNEVWLGADPFVTIDSVRLGAVWSFPLPDNNNPQLKASLEITNRSAQEVSAQVQVMLEPKNFTGNTYILPPKEVRLKPGVNNHAFSEVILQPVLWWTWERGDPNLYRVTIKILSGTAVLASKEVDFGFREVRVGTDWRWYLNGQPFFVRGASYASTQYLSQATGEWLSRDIELAKSANLNLLRVYTHVEPPAFYALADRAGLLLWQDFPLSWGYADTPSVEEEALRQMEAMITLLSNHPSVAIWSVHNESPWSFAGYSKYDSQYDRRQNKNMDEKLRGLAQELDPTRYVHLSSGTGDAHLFPGWEDGEWTDYADLPGKPFVSEFGAQALPDIQMIYQIFTPLERQCCTGEIRLRWEFQGFQPRNAFNVAKIDLGEPSEGDDQLAEFIKNSQAYQANLLQYAIENYRRAKYDPMQGVIQYMLVDAWQGLSWSVLDFDRQPKQGFQALQTAMQPILPSIQPLTLPKSLERRYWVYPPDTNPSFQLWVVNDTLLAYPSATLTWRIQSPAGREIMTDQQFIGINPDSVAQITLLNSLVLEPGRYQLMLTLSTAEGEILGTNTFYFTLLPQPPPEEASTQGQ